MVSVTGLHVENPGNGIAASLYSGVKKPESGSTASGVDVNRASSIPSGDGRTGFFFGFFSAEKIGIDSEDEDGRFGAVSESGAFSPIWNGIFTSSGKR